MFLKRPPPVSTILNTLKKTRYIYSIHICEWLQTSVFFVKFYPYLNVGTSFQHLSDQKTLQQDLYQIEGSILISS